MSNLTVKFINKEYSIPEDLLIYIDLLSVTENAKAAIYRDFLRNLSKEENACIDNEQMRGELERQVSRFIAMLTENGVYDRTVNDYINGNAGYKLISKVNADALEEAKRVLINEMNEFQAGYESALYKKDSSVTGMGFSIWSSSFVNHAIYAAMEASTLHKQEQAAIKEYQKDIDELNARIESRKNQSQRTYIVNTYQPNMEAAVTVFVYELLDTYISDLIKNGKMDKDTLKYINIDRSNDLLKNLTLSSNKEEILYRAFEACPYNLQVYSRALNYGFLDYETYKTAEHFKQGKNIIFSLVGNLGDVEYPKKFKINYDVAEKMAEFTQSDIVTILQVKTKEYVAAVVREYQNVFELISNKEQCYKIIRGLTDNSLLAGDVISNGTAQAQVNSIVSISVWNQLVNKCGYGDLFEKIKIFLPTDVHLQTKEEIDAYLIEKLTCNFEEARQSIIAKINAQKEAEEKRKMEQEKQKAERERIRKEKAVKRKTTIKKGSKIFTIIVAVIAVLIVIFSVISLFINNVITPANKYNDAVALIENGDWLEARDVLLSLDDYKDSDMLLEQCNNNILDYKYDSAVQMMHEEKYADAITIFEELNGYKDSEELILKCKTALWDVAYANAVQLMKDEKYESAISSFESIIDYKDSKEKIEECKNCISEKIYNDAITLANTGSYKDAITVLEELGDYKNSNELIEKYKFLSCKKGDEIVFGTYEQDNNLVNGDENIEWIVLERKGNQALIISKYCIEQKPFNETYSSVLWENCTLRKWLNNNFLNVAFSEKEKTKILSSNISTEGRSTKDKIFLLSEKEAVKYFKTDYDRKTDATEYVSTSHCYWLLRNTGSVSNVAHVDYNGEVGYYENVDRNWWVRPAMWVEISE